MTSEAFLREAKLMHSQLHDNLVQLLAVCTTEEPIWIITELMVHGSLLDYLRNDAGAAVTFAVIVDMAAQVSSFPPHQRIDNSGKILCSEGEPGTAGELFCNDGRHSSTGDFNARKISYHRFAEDSPVRICLITVLTFYTPKYFVKSG